MEREQVVVVDMVRHSMGGRQGADDSPDALVAGLVDLAVGSGMAGVGPNRISSETLDESKAYVHNADWVEVDVDMVALEVVLPTAREVDMAKVLEGIVPDDWDLAGVGVVGMKTLGRLSACRDVVGIAACKPGNRWAEDMRDEQDQPSVPCWRCPSAFGSQR